MSTIATLPEMLRAQASRIPDQPLIFWRGRSVTYGEFDARTDELAGGLGELGVKPGDVVSVLLPNCLELLEAWWAILKAGAVFGPINPSLAAPELAYVLGHDGVGASHRIELERAAAVRRRIEDSHQQVDIGDRRIGPAEAEARRAGGGPDPLGPNLKLSVGKTNHRASTNAMARDRGELEGCGRVVDVAAAMSLHRSIGARRLGRPRAPRRTGAGSRRAGAGDRVGAAVA
jgi:acyl-CoA synthetase (AMP-forming)/AMP-acid ligase II